MDPPIARTQTPQNFGYLRPSHTRIANILRNHALGIIQSLYWAIAYRVVNVGHTSATTSALDDSGHF